MLTVSGITLHYGAAQALRGVSLTAKPGEVTCVLGRNGVGKTSLLRALIGHQPISGGSIQFEGKAIDRMKPEDRARLGIAYVPQGREIFPLLSVKENLETGYAPWPARTGTCLKSCSSCFRSSKPCSRAAAVTFPAASSSSSPSLALW